MSEFIGPKNKEERHDTFHQPSCERKSPFGVLNTFEVHEGVKDIGCSRADGITLQIHLLEPNVEGVPETQNEKQDNDGSECWQRDVP